VSLNEASLEIVKPRNIEEFELGKLINGQKNSLKECVFINSAHMLSKIHFYALLFRRFCLLGIRIWLVFRVWYTLSDKTMSDKSDNIFRRWWKITSDEKIVTSRKIIHLLIYKIPDHTFGQNIKLY